MKRRFGASVVDATGLSHLTLWVKTKKRRRSSHIRVTVRSRLRSASPTVFPFELRIRGSQVLDASPTIDIREVSTSFQKILIPIPASKKWQKNSFTVLQHTPSKKVEFYDCSLPEIVPTRLRNFLLICLVALVVATGITAFTQLDSSKEEAATAEVVVVTTSTTTTSTTTTTTTTLVPLPSIKNLAGHALPTNQSFEPPVNGVKTSLFASVPKDDSPWLIIPRLTMSMPIVVGVKDSDLAEGVGWYEKTARLGTKGNIGIAGHRTSFPAPFYFLDKMRVSDSVYLVAGNYLYRYLVVPNKAGQPYDVVEPSALDVIEDLGFDAITLTTCTPIGSVEERLIVHAKLFEKTLFTGRQ